MVLDNITYLLNNFINCCEYENRAKVLISVHDGYCRVEYQDFNSFNEGNYLQAAAEAYKQRTGHYPARILVDRMFRTRDNYQFCKKHEIKISNFKLSRPPQDLKPEQIQEERIAEGLRNEVEGKFGTGKHKFMLNRLLMRLPETSLIQIVLVFLVMNLNKAMMNFLYPIFKEHFLRFKVWYGQFLAMLIKNCDNSVGSKYKWLRSLMNDIRLFEMHFFIYPP